jgi:2'-5' RNA ligase
MHTSRLFIALPLPQAQRTILLKWQAYLKDYWHFEKWVNPADLHITLFFLGEATFEQGLQIKEQLKLLSGELSPFQLQLNGLGIFGSLIKPRILYSKVAGELEPLQALQKKISGIAEPIGFIPDERSYNPHITIARRYNDQQPFPHQRLEGANMEGSALFSWSVKECVLYRTLLGNDPMYQAVAVFPFERQT